MDGLMMKYFVLKPAGNDIYAKASRRAMRAYATLAMMDNPQFAAELEEWATREMVAAGVNDTDEEMYP